MGKTVINIIEDTFSRKFSTAKELSILLGVDSFTYIITDTDKKVQVLKSFALDTKGNISLVVKALKNIFSEEKALKSPFNSICLGIENGYTVLIPASFYTETQRNSYLQQLMAIDEKIAVFTNDLPAQEVKNVFGVPTALLDFFEAYLPGFHILHFSTLFIKAVEPFALTQSNTQVYLYIRPNDIRIVIFDKGRLLYTNHFICQTEKDVLYYVMLALEQQGLDNKTTPVFIMGQLLEVSELYHLLYRYIQNISFFEEKTKCKPGDKLSKHPSWFYFDILSF